MSVSEPRAGEGAPRRVLHVISGLRTGGAEQMLARLVARPSATIKHAVLSLSEPGALAAEIAAASVEVLSLGLSPALPSPASVARGVGFARRFAPDLVQSWLYHADAFATLAFPFVGRPRLVWNLRCSDMDLTQYGTVTRLLPALLAPLSRIPDAVVCNAEAVRDAHLRRGYRARRWEIIPNGFDLARFRPDPARRAAARASLGVPDEATVIALPARLDPMKDHATFLRAARLLDRAGDVRFALLGRGTEPDNAALRPLLGEGPRPERLLCLGERREIEGLMPGFDIVSLTSSFGEGFPNVLGEAMACGVPCVATEVGDAAAIVGDTGRIVPRRDAAALAAAWRDLVALGSAGRTALGARARQRIAERYAIEAVVERYENLYRDLIGSRPAASACAASPA